MNKQLLSILSIVVSIAIALGIYIYFAQIEDKNIKPIQIVPDNAAIIIESNNSSQHLKNLFDPTFMERLLGNEKVAAFYKQMSLYDSLIKQNETLSEWFSIGQAVYSFHCFENKELGFFMAVQTQKEVDPTNALAFFQLHFPSQYKVSKRKFLNEELFDFTDFKDGTHFTIAFKSKLMIFSPNGSLVEMALIKIGKQINEQVIEDKLAFVKNSGNGLNIYFNFKNLPTFLQSFCNESYQNAFTILGNFGERVIYNVEADDEELFLKGATQTHETNFQYLDLLNAQAPIQNNLRNLLPEGIHFSYTFGFNGYNSFFKNVNEYLLSRRLFTPYKSYLDSIERHLQYSFTNKFASKIGNHAALFAMDEPGLWKDSCYISAVEIVDEPGMEVLMAEMERSVQRKYASDTTVIKSDTNDLKIARAYFGDAFKFYFTDLFEGMNARYYVKRNGYYFFANNPNILVVLKNRWATEKLLVKQEAFKNFNNKLSPNSNLEILILNEHAPKFALNFLNNEWFSILNQNMGTIKRAHFMGIQFAGSNDKIFPTQIYTHFNITKAEKTEKIWEITLDTSLLTQPQVIYNFSIGNQVIMAQDAKLQLYMIDREGKVLWKQKIDDKVISKFEEIDLFNNGKRQWVFNTAHYIYLIDDQGKNLSGWPVWIPTGTAYPITVFDPNKDRNFQIFATGNYFKIAAFNQQGRLIPNWNPKDIWPNFKSPIGSFSFAGEQVYYGLNEKGRIQFLNAQAKPFTQIKIDTAFEFLEVKIESIDTGQILITALDSNQIVRINYFSTRPAKIARIPAKGFNTLKVSKNESNQVSFLLFGNNKLSVIDQNANLILQKNVAINANSLINWSFIGNGYKLVYQDSTTNSLNIENSKGETYKPFPMKMNSPYVIGNLFNESDNWLIFAQNNQLNLYRIK
jgi:hypothetical protein